MVFRETPETLEVRTGRELKIPASYVRILETKCGNKDLAIQRPVGQRLGPENTCDQSQLVIPK